MRLDALLFVCATLLLAQPALAQRPAQTLCPPTIQIQASLESTPEGWAEVKGDGPYRLKSIAFSEGAPSEGVFLVENASKDVGKERTATWLFDSAGGTIWVSCYYSGTRVSITRPVDGKPRVCKVSSNRRVTIDGMPEVVSSVCTR
jgi:hypothetical protein